MRKAPVFVLISLLLAVCSPAQESEIVKISYINAHFTDTVYPPDVMVAFLVATTDSADFPPQVNIPPKCTAFENGREKVVLLSPHNLAVAFYDRNSVQKNTEAHHLVDGHLDLNAVNPEMIITYKVLDIPYRFNKMSMTPSFAEKRNKVNKVAKRFEFTIR